VLIFFVRFCVRLVRIVSLCVVTVLLILCLLFELKQLQVGAQCFHPKLLHASKLGLGFCGFWSKDLYASVGLLIFGIGFVWKF
jgi:hypothetical protein